MLKAKKGFSLIELLVVIAIIGVLSAVGITAYTGYTADAKVKVTKAQHQQVLALVNAEEAKCASGSGTYAWTGNCNAIADIDQMLTHFNTAMGMVSAFNNEADFAIKTGTPALGQMLITVAATGITTIATEGGPLISTATGGDARFGATVNPY